MLIYSSVKESQHNKYVMPNQFCIIKVMFCSIWSGQMRWVYVSEEQAAAKRKLLTVMKPNR